MSLSITKAILFSGICLAAIQAVRPARVNPPIDNSQTVRSLITGQPRAMAAIDRSCGDCHSNETTWPWYSSVAPVSWLIAHDVNEGRAELNFSEWGNYSPEKRAKLLKKSCEEAREGEMPLAIYTWLHPAAKPSATDIAELCSLTDSGE